MNVFRICACLTLAMALGSFTATSSAQTPPGGRIMTMTRQVAEFSQKEHALADALHKADHASTDRLIAADFELRDSSALNQPTPRAQWIASAHPDAAAEQMAAHDYGDVVVVSFINRADKPASAAFVVDVWHKQGADWQLAVRYQSPLLSARKMRRGDIAPTGKD
jgi:hypothetical protein